MPRYSKDINYIIPLPQVEGMIRKTENPRDKLIVALLYITGARPSEILELKKEDIWEEGGDLIIKLKTKKLGKGRKFKIKERLLKIRRSFPFFDVIDKNRFLIPINITLRRVEQIVEGLSDKKLCPYNFRHTRFTKLSRIGATRDMLMYWKGSLDSRSVDEYLKGKKVEFDKIE